MQSSLMSQLYQYTVEYYKQKEDESGYDLVTEDTERIEAIIDRGFCRGKGV